jgi:putative nucleotidyltransferase with HDIG domain
LNSIRGAAFLFFVLVSIVLYYEVITIVMTVSGLMSELTDAEENGNPDVSESSLALWNKRLSRYLKPLTYRRDEIQIRLNAQSDQISLLSRHVNHEKKRSAQLTLLMELSQQLENLLDQPVAAQLTVNSLERALNCDLACLFVHEPDQKEFVLLAAAGKQVSMAPSGYRQSVSNGMLGRAMRQRKTQLANDTSLDADYISFENTQNLSAIVIPLIFNGYVNGAITLDSETLNAFSSADVWMAEMAAAELTRAWERSRYHQRLMTLVQTGSQLSAMVQPETTGSEVSAIAREVLQARFTFVQIHLGQEKNFTQSAHSGEAPRLLESIQNSENSESLIQMAFHAVQPFRVRDVRKYSPTSHLTIDHAGLRSMLAIPIRWHRLNIGTILAFGKQNEVFFNENDQSLAELLSIQAGGAFESAWLQQELRSSLRTTSLLYRLSNQIIQTDNLQNAAFDISKTAHKIAKGLVTGLVLFDQNGNILAEAQVNEEGVHIGLEHPMDIIRDVLASGEIIYLSQGNSIMRACLPIQTPILKYGVLWMDLMEDAGHKSTTTPNDLRALVNQTAIALERSLLLVESRRQAAEIKSAYDKLEVTYDQTLAALMSALDARDRETEGHSSRVSQLTAKLGRALNFSHEQLKVLERGSLLHDIGKIGISDTILHKPGPLSEEEWVVMRRHPDIGARIVKGIPFLEDTIPLIRHHQERWDGTGYPDGLRGEEIPILARMFSIVDAYDALTSTRPYRQKISSQEALEYLHEQAGILFDPYNRWILKRNGHERQSQAQRIYPTGTPGFPVTCCDNWHYVVGRNHCLGAWQSSDCRIASKNLALDLGRLLRFTTRILLFHPRRQREPNPPRVEEHRGCRNHTLRLELSPPGRDQALNLYPGLYFRPPAFPFDYQPRSIPYPGVWRHHLPFCLEPDRRYKLAAHLTLWIYHHRLRRHPYSPTTKGTCRAAHQAA